MMRERRRPFAGEVSRGHLMAMFCEGNFENYRRQFGESQ